MLSAIAIPFDRNGLKEPTWENILVGEEFGPLDVVISGQAVTHHLVLPDAQEREVTLRKRLVVQLAQVGYAPTDITYLALSQEQTRATRASIEAFLVRTGAQLWIQHSTPTSRSLPGQVLVFHLPGVI